jgi:hypothetical protein
MRIRRKLKKLLNKLLGRCVMNKNTPDSLMIYYGWLNSFNSSTNSWTSEKVAQDLARYDLIVVGDGVQDSSHGDYSNTQVILPRIKELNPSAKVFGYVTVNQTYASFKSKVDGWETLEVDGIFLDESGYDYGKTRSEFNDRVDYVHSQIHAKLCFANAWNLDHILGIVNDASYVNTTYNIDKVESNLLSSDYVLLESLAINTDSYTSTSGYESQTQWKARVDKAIALRKTYGINMVGCGIINDSNSNWSRMYDFGYTSVLIAGLDGYGVSDTLYGASSAKGKFYSRPSIMELGNYWSLDPAIGTDGNKHLRYLKDGKLTIDFTSSSESSSIDRY